MSVWPDVALALAMHDMVHLEAYRSSAAAA
jgi:hypothetical protein